MSGTEDVIEVQPEGVRDDPLLVRLDFHCESIIMTDYEDGVSETKLVRSRDIARAMYSELTMNSGLLSPSTLWWENTQDGTYKALWRPPGVVRVALQTDAMGVPTRWKIPMPGLIFLCSPGKTPWVWAAKKRPERETDTVYKAPCFNVFRSGEVCPGSHKFPERLEDIPASFFMSFFTAHGDPTERSKKYPRGLDQRWASLDGEKVYPLDDLVEAGNVQGLIERRKGGYGGRY